MAVDELTTAMPEKSSALPEPRCIPEGKPSERRADYGDGLAHPHPQEGLAQSVNGSMGMNRSRSGCTAQQSTQRLWVRMVY